MSSNILERLVNVKNRSMGDAGYTLDSGKRRNWTPGEIKKNIPVSELEEATFVPGGFALIQKYLVINDPDVCEYLGIQTEPEYFYGEDEIKTLLLRGTDDQLLDCLDFAPSGVIDLVKKYAVDLKLNSLSKREIILNKTRFDVSAAISNVDFASAPEVGDQKATGRRSTPITGDDKKKSEVSEGRRTEGLKTPKYTRA